MTLWMRNDNSWFRWILWIATHNKWKIYTKWHTDHKFVCKQTNWNPFNTQRCARFACFVDGFPYEPLEKVYLNEFAKQKKAHTHTHILFKTAIHWSARIYMEKTDTHKKISQWRDTYIQIQYPLVSFVFSFRVVKQNWTNIDDREREQRCPGWHKRVKKAGKKSKAVRMSKRFSLLCKYRDFDAFSLFGINMSIAVPACIITLKPLMGAHRVQCSLSHCFKYRINK